MTEHAVYTIGSPAWWSGIAIFVAYAAVVIGAARWLKGEGLKTFERVWGIALAALLLAKHVYLHQSGLWSVHENLELHLCGFSRILSIVLLISGARWAFYPLFFWGIVGGFHSLLTPELTGGDTPFMYAEYYIVHGGIIIIPLYFVWVREGARHQPAFDGSRWNCQPPRGSELHVFMPAPHGRQSASYRRMALLPHCLCCGRSPALLCTHPAFLEAH